MISMVFIAFLSKIVLGVVVIGSLISASTAYDLVDNNTDIIGVVICKVR